MAAIKIICPDCDKEMNAPAHIEGKKIRCKECGTTFVAKEAKAKPKQAAKKSVPAKKKRGGSPTEKGANRAPDPIMDMQLESQDEIEDLPTMDDDNGDDDSQGLKEMETEHFGFAADDDDDDDGNPYDLGEEEDLSNRCPHCANKMEYEGAVVCLHCGYNTQTRVIGSTKKTYDLTGLDYFIWWLPGILCVLGIISLTTFDIVWCTQSHKWFDPEDWMSYLAHFAVKLWLVVISLFMMFYMGKFGFKRLVIDNQPPEVEKR